MATTSGMLEKLNGNEKTNKLPMNFKGMKSDAIQRLFENYKPLIAQVLPQHLKVERVIGIMVSTLSKNPKLAECTLPSVIGGVITSSILGLELNTPLQQCFLIPYSNNGNMEAEFQLGYKGMSDIAYRNTNVLTIETEDVRENDEFDYEKGLNPCLKHKPAKNDRGKLTHAYAIVRLKSGGVVFTVLNKSQIESVRMRSKGGQSKYSPWNNNIDEDYAKMARKTALRSLFNSGQIPYSLEMKYLELDGNKVNMEMFANDGSGDYDLLQAEETKVEVITSEPEQKKDEPKPEATSEPVKTKTEETKVEEIKPETEKQSVNDTFVQEVKKSIAKQIQAENRKSKAATSKFTQILKDYKSNSLSDLMEKLNEDELQSVLEILKLVNEESLQGTENENH